MRQGLIGSVLVLFTSACAGRPTFLPSAPATGSQPISYGAAIYDMATSDGDWGEVRVWSRGVVDKETAARERRQITIQPFIHAGFEILNQTNQALTLRLTQMQLEIFLIDNESISVVERPIADDKIQVDKGALGKLNVAFPLKNDFPLRNITAYKIHWTLAAGRKNYVQTTLFTRSANAPQTAAFWPYQPYNSPENSRVDEWSFLTPLGVRFGTVER